MFFLLLISSIFWCLLLKAIFFFTSKNNFKIILTVQIAQNVTTLSRHAGLLILQKSCALFPPAADQEVEPTTIPHSAFISVI